jgi:hypothetical protein
MIYPHVVLFLVSNDKDRQNSLKRCVSMRKIKIVYESRGAGLLTKRQRNMTFWRLPAGGTEIE